MFGSSYRGRRMFLQRRQQLKTSQNKLPHSSVLFTCKELRRKCSTVWFYHQPTAQRKWARDKYVNLLCIISCINIPAGWTKSHQADLDERRRPTVGTAVSDGATWPLLKCVVCSNKGKIKWWHLSKGMFLFWHLLSSICKSARLITDTLKITFSNIPHFKGPSIDFSLLTLCWTQSAWENSCVMSSVTEGSFRLSKNNSCDEIKCNFIYITQYCKSHLPPGALRPVQLWHNTTWPVLQRSRVLHVSATPPRIQFGVSNPQLYQNAALK